MKASLLGEAIERVAAARAFMWEHVPAGTLGKVQHDHELFMVAMKLKAELTVFEVELQRSVEAKTIGSPA